MPRLLITAERRDGNGYFKSISLLLSNPASRTDSVAYLELIEKDTGETAAAAAAGPGYPAAAPEIRGEPL